MILHKIKRGLYLLTLLLIATSFKCFAVEEVTWKEKEQIYIKLNNALNSLDFFIEIAEIGNLSLDYTFNGDVTDIISKTSFIYK